jgi:hypothetical protein
MPGSVNWPFVEGVTLGQRVVCCEGLLLIDLLQNGQRVEVMSLGPCPHCLPDRPQETPSQESATPQP